MESNRRYNALTTTLKRHDVAALAERKRRHLVQTPTFEGCRCCYDPTSDGGGGSSGSATADYPALVEYYQQHHYSSSNNETNDNENEKQADSEDDDSDDEFDYLLDEDFSSTTNNNNDNDNNDEEYRTSLQQAEEARRAQLEWEILQRQVAMQHGYGTHRQMHPLRVLKAAGLTTTTTTTTGANNTMMMTRPPPPAVVLHLVDPDSRASASLDFLLETRLAMQYPGTIFMRSVGRTTLLMNAPLLVHKHFPMLNVDGGDGGDLPALVAIREGQVVNISKGLREVCQYEGGEIEPRAVEMWLEQSGVLRHHPPSYDSLCFIRPEEEALMEYLGQKGPIQQQHPEERFFDCGVAGCCKTFPHEHVGIKNSEQDGLVLKEETILDGNEGKE